MANHLFCVSAGLATHNPRLYEDCGLDNIWLVNGFEPVTRHGEELMEVEDREGLHRAIALHLVRFRKALTGREIKFIRRVMDLTQGELAYRLNTGVQTVARWEKDKVAIPGPEDRLLRIHTMLAVSKPEAFAELVRMLPRDLDEIDEGPERPVQFEHDACWTEAQLKAA